MVLAFLNVLMGTLNCWAVIVSDEEKRDDIEGNQEVLILFLVPKKWSILFPLSLRISYSPLNDASRSPKQEMSEFPTQKPQSPCRRSVPSVETGNWE